MKDYSVSVIVNGADRTFHVRAYDWCDAQGQVDKAYRGHQEYEITEIAELSILAEKDATPPTPQEVPGVYSKGDKKYWWYIRADIRCYDSINPGALADAFKTAQDEGCYTASQLEAIAAVLVDATTHTAAIQGLTA